MWALEDKWLMARELLMLLKRKIGKKVLQ